MKHLDHPVLQLKPREDRRLRRGHPWVFSNEVDVAASPLNGFTAGSAIDVVAHHGVVLGSAYVNPATLICARMISRRSGVRLDRELLIRRLQCADDLRRRSYERPFYRAVFAESDGLPGLVVDRFGDVVVVQVGTAGMESVVDAIVDAVETVFAPRAVVLRNDGPGRNIEGLERYVNVVGPSQECGTVLVEENGARFEVDPIHGQKTGWFFDHRENRARLAQFVRGATVLDLYSYSGAWGIQAALAGAREVLCVDTSEPAVALASRNALLNGVATQVTIERSDALDRLRSLKTAGRRFDVVILDPPAFIPRRKDIGAGLHAYRRVNRLAVQVLSHDGILVSASCSSHLAMAELGQVVQDAACYGERRARFLVQGGQGADHPVHPVMPESAYLKAIIARIY